MLRSPPARLLMISIDIKVEIEGLDRFNRELKEDLLSSGQGDIRKALNSWFDPYLDYIYARFTRFSQGLGNWVPLSPNTIRKKGHATILVDTGTLKLAFHRLGRRTMTREAIPGGLRVTLETGFYHEKFKGPIGALAAIHHYGTEHVPSRAIFVDPDPPTTQQLSAILEKAIAKAMKKHGL